MEDRITGTLSRELGIDAARVRSTMSLLDDGNTVPFIARYRKEATGGLTDVQIRGIAARLEALRALEQRRADVLRLISDLGRLTPGVAAAIDAATTVTELDDIYRPFRPRRRTRASVARDRGLEPLADLIFDPPRGAPAPEVAARQYLSEDVPDVDAALAGARDIIAERVSDDPRARALAREATLREGVVTARKKADTEGDEYRNYSDFREPVARIPPHRVLALDRGEATGALAVRVEAPDEVIETRMKAMFVGAPRTPHGAQVALAVEDGYRRLVAPAVEREVRSALTERAEQQAIRVFGQNLRSLLLEPPVRGRVVLGIDPGFRTGCKLAVVDATGRVLATGTAHVTASSPAQVRAGEELVAELIRRHHVTLVAIGNGTASRETEQVVARVLAAAGREVKYVIVNEAGASVYSASPLAAEELPGLDVSLRGAVSIARRVQDPLAELVKVEPRSIGVGQYQHDVDQKRLAARLDDVVEDAVNSVGLDLNTASPALLGHVAGIKVNVASAIVAWRDRHGPFVTRASLTGVPGLGARSFEQCAGFLRVPGGVEPLDDTAVHPESYPVADAVLAAARASRRDLAGGGKSGIAAALSRVDADAVARQTGAGLPTVRDIIAALQQPGRDPREDLPGPVLRSDVLKLADLKPGMELTGTVRNVVDFGAFVDIGVHQDGLVHVSEMSERYVRHPTEVVAVGDVVKVRVLAVDLARMRISLTMKN